jgi:hypothetical protein
MVTYDLMYHGAEADSVRDRISTWCDGHDCALEVLTLTAGLRFRIIGEQHLVRQAVGMIRHWIRAAA